MAEAEYWRFTVARDCQKKNTSENHSGMQAVILAPARVYHMPPRARPTSSWWMIVVLLLALLPAVGAQQYAKDVGNFLCRRSFGITPPSYPLPCRAPADDYSSPLVREFVIGAWAGPTISPVDQLCFGRPVPGSSHNPKTSWTYPGCNATCCNASALDQV